MRFLSCMRLLTKRMRGASAIILGLLLGSGPGRAQMPETEGLEELPPVYAGRTLTIAAFAAPQLREWDGKALREGGSPMLDLLLQEEPAFSLYRRQDSRFAHPTTQGANLRTLGATAASRTLVLRDGVPQNDPFGGWIPWSRFQADALQRVEILPAPQASVWGNASAAGVIRMQSRDPWREGSSVELLAGDGSSYGAAIHHRQSAGLLGLVMSGRTFRSDGDHTVHANDRGQIDRRADLEVESIELGLHWKPAERWTLQPAWSYFEEERGNGTPLARNGTRAWDFSLHTVGQFGGASIEAVAYHQERRFRNVFTAVDDERNAENPVLDQFDIEGRGTGGSLVGSWANERDWQWILGVDARLIEGQTHEDYGFGLGNRRRAGGEQAFYGVFAKLGLPLREEHSLEASVRMDHWRSEEGMRVEQDLESGELLVDDLYPDRSGYEPSASLQWNWRPASGRRVSAAVAQAFRFPTINELYRPYRVGSDVFAANPALDPESFTTVELSFLQPLREHWSLQLGVFHTWIEDGIANVHIADGPRESPGGFVPAGGSYNRRENVDRAYVTGVPLRLRGRLGERMDLRLDYQWSRAEFERSRLQEELEERDFPQAPDHRWMVRIDYRLRPKLQLEVAWAGASGQYDDPLNQRPLRSFQRWDLGLSLELEAGLSLRLSVRDLFDEAVLTGVDSDGIRSIAPGRFVSLSARWEH